MNSPTRFIVDIFAEDHAHEAFIRAVTHRFGREHRLNLITRVRNGRGGHGRVMTEFKLFQRAVMMKQASGTEDIPDIIIIAIDANCQRFAQASKGIKEHVKPEFADRAVIACPDPHIEKWYLADADSFYDIVGRQPRAIRKKCERDIYKKLLAETILSAGHPLTLGGIEFAEDLVNVMDFYRAGRKDQSLNAFITDLKRHFKRLQG
jgi:hypothetical protein